MARAYDFSGIWHSKYRVESGPEKKVIVTEHDVVLYKKDNHLIAESLPNRDGSYLMGRFTLDGRIVTGTYHSQNSPLSAAKQAMYYGAAQLVLDPDGNALRGKGVGFGKDMEVKMSEWELFRVKDSEAKPKTIREKVAGKSTHSATVS
jgi:hypothetical protein